MNIPAEQEAERRYGVRDSDASETASDLRGRERAFIAGAEWSESRYRELLEAAREYREAKVASARAAGEMATHFWDDAHDETFDAMVAAEEAEARAGERLRAAAAALNEEGGE